MTTKEDMHRLHLVLLLLTVYATLATSIVTSKYRKLEPGQNVTGILLSELKTKSKLQCSDRLVFIYTKAKADAKAIFFFNVCRCCCRCSDNTQITQQVGNDFVFAFALKLQCSDRLVELVD